MKYFFYLATLGFWICALIFTREPEMFLVMGWFCYISAVLTEIKEQLK